ncbi:MAG: type II toxin-antitoxin system PemK/MazF family toxin [Treponemataceae bacterium]|nr:type II toxin-antitoxin system PemK/MazF family toxin [Treponemataceae bacterium]
MGMVNQYEVHLINLDPTIGHEIKKMRPCLVISPNEMNQNTNFSIRKSPSTMTFAPLRFWNFALKFLCGKRAIKPMFCVRQCRMGFPT